MKDRRDQLYDNLINSGKVGESEIGNRDEFKAAIKDEAASRQFYNNIIKSGLLSDEEIGSEDDFYNSISSDFSVPSPGSTKQPMLDEIRQTPAAEQKPSNTPAFDPAEFQGTIDKARQTVGQTQQSVNRIGNMQKRMGLDLPQEPVRLGQNRKVTKGEQRFNLDKGRMESTYVTKAGNEYENRAMADIEQNLEDQAEWERNNPKEALKQRIESQIRDIDSRMSGYQGEWVDADGRVHYSGGSAGDEAMRNLENARHDLMESLQQMERSETLSKSDGILGGIGLPFTKDFFNNWKNFGYAVWDRMNDVGWWENALTGGINDLEKAGVYMKIKNKLDQGRELSDQEMDVVLAGMASAQAQKYIDLPLGYTAGTITADMAPFMAQMAINPAGGLGKTVARQAVRKFGRNGIGAISARVAGRVLGNVGEAAVLSNTLQAPRTIGNIMQRNAGDSFMYDEDGNLHMGHYEDDDNGNPVFVEGGKGILRSAYEGEASSIIENFTELGTGGSINKFVKKMAASKAGRAFGIDYLTDLIGKIGTTPFAKGMKRFMERTHWDGMIEEPLEEEYGIILNSLLGTGDAKISDLWDSEEQAKIFAGTLWFGGMMGAMNTAAYPLYRRNLKKQVAQADINGQAAFGQQWDQIKESVEALDDKEIGNFLYGIKDDDAYTNEQKAALFGYAARLKQYQGANVGDMLTRMENNLSSSEKAIGNAYERGADADTPDEKKQYVDDLQAAEQALPEYGQEFARMVAESQNPVETLDYLMQNRDYFTDDQIAAAADFFQKQARAQGVMDAALDGVDLEVEKANSEVRANMHQQTGQVITAQIGDGAYYIIGGDVVTDEETGMPVVTGTGGAVVVKDAMTGEVSVKPAQQAAITSMTNADDMIRYNESVFRQELTQQADDDITYGSPANEVFDLEDTVTLQDGNGGIIEGQVVTLPNAVDGVFVIQTADRRALQMTADDINRRIVAHNGQEVQRNVPQTGQNVPNTEGNVPETPENVPDQGKNDNQKWPINVQESASKEAENQQNQPQAAESETVGNGQLNGQNQEQQQPQSALSRIPVRKDKDGQPLKNKKGRPVLDWHKASVEDAAAALVETTNGNMVMARDTASDLVRQAQDRKEKIAKQKPKGEDPIEIAESRMEIQKQLDEQQAIIKQWQDVGTAIRKQMEAAEAERRAAEEAAKSEEQRQREAEEARIRKEKQDAIDAERRRKKIEEELASWNKPYAPLAKARKEMEGDPDAMDILNRTEPESLEEWVSSLIQPQSMMWDDETDPTTGRTVIGLQSELGLQKKDIERIGGLVASSQKGGKPFGQVVHDIWEQLPEGLKNMYDDQDVRNTLIGLFGEGNAMRMRHLTEEHRIEEARAMMKENLRKEAEAEMDAWAEAYHLTPEERETFEEFLALAPMEGAEAKLINQIIEENEKSDRRSEALDMQPAGGTAGRESEGGEGQVQGQGAAETAGNYQEQPAVEPGAETGNGEPPLPDSNVSGGEPGAIAASEQLKPTDLRDAVRVESPEIGVAEANARARQAAGEPQPIGTGDFGDIYDQFRGKPKEAIDFLTKNKGGEALGALSHKDIGEIDLVWGEEGTGYSDGYGLAKLVKYHPEVLDNLQEILDGMEVVKRTENRINLESDKYKAAVRLTWNEESKTWLLTVFEKKNSALDNTTDTGETSFRGKRNDTATPQSTVSESRLPNEPEGSTLGSPVSDGKVTNNFPNNQENSEKSSQLGKTSSPEQIAEEEAKVDTNPTEGQKEAGNYQKGHINIDGYDITIENPKGSVRSGVDAKGNAWEQQMHNTYGYIRGTEGVDGDHIDVFLSDNPTSGSVFVVDQINPDTLEFDEHKVMYGFPDAESAEQAYLSNYEEGWGGLGEITEVSREEFKKWVESSHRKTKPFAEYKSVKKEQPKQKPEKQHKRIVSDDQMEELKKKLREKFGNLNAGIDPERMILGAMYAVGKIERGVTKFADYAREMIDEIGDAIRPYLKAFYESVRQMPEAAAYRDQMDSQEYVNAFDEYNFDKGGKVPDAITKAQQVETKRKAKQQVKKIEKEVKQKIEQGNLFEGDLFGEQTQEKQVRPKLDKNDYRTYMTPEAVEYFANDPRFAKFPHKDLAFITAAVWDGVVIPVEELAKVPGIVKAEQKVKAKEQIKPFTLTDEQVEEYAKRLLDSEHGSAVFDGDKIHKVDGQEDFSGPVRQERKAFVIIGRPAGGKSSVFANPLSSQYGARIIDSDVVKEWFDEFDNGYGAGYVQNMSSKVAERALDIAAQNGDNLVLPRIGGNSVMTLSVALRAMGYDVQLYYNDIVPDTSYMRSNSRFAMTGRYLSLDYLTSIKDKPSKFFSNFAEKNIGDYLDECTETQVQILRRRIESMAGSQRGDLQRTLYGWLEQRGRRNPDGGISANVERPESDGSSARIDLNTPIFSYSEWKSNDVAFGEKPKEIWNSNSGEPMPGKKEETKNERKQEVSREPESAGEGTGQTGGSADRPGTERGPEQDRAERSGSGRTVETPRRVSEGGSTRESASVGPTENSTDGKTRGTGGAFHNNRRNNVGERGKDYAPLSPKARFNTNVEAIKMMRALMEDGVEAPTKDQMEVLRQYSGWGGLGTYFNDESSAENKQLRDLLSDEEYNDAVMSINSAYFTPAVVIDSMWDIAKAMGFTGGKVLEGSAGIGNIIGQMPREMSRRSDIEAVEIDKISGNILKLLYPDAKVHIEGFQDVKIPNGSVDLAITNVPFVTGLHVFDKVDKDLSRKFTNIHDFCIAKNIRKLREGGIGIFISSSGTLDKSNDLRAWITSDGQADVVGAFRLNNETFGGTTATSDIIVVRKRVNGQKSDHAIDVSKASPMRVGTYEDKYGDTKQVTMTVNDYFKEHPDMMAGEMAFGYEKGDTFRPGSYGLYPVEGKNQEKMLKDFVKSMASAKETTPVTDTTTQKPQQNQLTEVKEGRMLIDDSGRLCVSRYGTAIPLGLNEQKVKGQTKQQCFKDYQAVQKAVDDVLQQQLNDPDDAALKPKLDVLNKAYDNFVKRYGVPYKNTSISFLKNDIDFPSFLALASYSETKDMNGKVTISSRKSPVFTQRVLGFKTEPKPKTVKDAVIASIFRSNGIDLEWIKAKLNEVAAPPNGDQWTTDDVRKGILVSRLGFEDPSTGQLEIRYKYLSGNVREKLAIAESYNTDGRYSANVEELQKVVPMDIPAHLIDFTLGSSWIPTELYLDYLKENYGLPDSTKLSHVQGRWVLDVDNWRANNETNKAKGVYSQKFRSNILGSDLVEAALNNRPYKVAKQETIGYGSDKSTRTVVDQEATQACNARIDEIKDEFKQFIRKRMQDDVELSRRIEKIYNDKFNALVPLRIDDEMLPEKFEDANKNISLYDHQKRGVMRGVTSPTMLAHEVGTGKSFTLITTAMEMRRLGTAKKPMIVVQNATVAQMTADAKLLYPNAKILSLSEQDRDAEGRRAFYAKIKFNDWDCIIIPQSTLDRIPDSPERELQFIQEQIDEKKHIIEQAMAAKMDSREIQRLKRELEKKEQEYGDKYLDSDPANGLVYDSKYGGYVEKSDKKKKKDAKREAASIDKAETKAKEKLDRATDDVQYFDDLGVDAILVDEAHGYKHLGFETSLGRSVKGVDPSYSKKCAGLYNKTRAVFEKAGWKNVVFATGTPISNTAAEIWTFMKYLMPADVMKANDIYYFDDFVHNFGSINQMLEFKTNGKFNEVTRFAAYVNRPELMRIWMQVADIVRTAEVGEVKSKVPEKEGGKDQDVFLPQSPSLVSIMIAVRSELERFENMDGKEKRENSSIPLTMYGIAKRAAIDPRLVNPDAPDEPMSKTNAAVKEIVNDLQKTKKYNGTVAVFCDNQNRLGAGGVVEFNIFDDMKAKLVAQGVPEKQIAIIKSSMSITAKQKIFDAVNKGEVRVILGSTQTLGTGVNIQERLHMLIHMDAPDRPMDYTQRNGRIERQGNLHRDWGLPIRILRFGVEDSLDVTAYQRLKTKSGFIDSIMNGKEALANNQTDRTIEEEEEGLFDNPVAVLSGSQFAMKKNQAERELRKLQGKYNAWEADQIYVASQLRANEGWIKSLQKTIEDDSKELEHIREMFPDGKIKVITVAGTKVDMTKAEADKRLNEVIKEKINDPVNAIVKRNRENQIYDDETLEYPIELDGHTVNFKVEITRTSEWDGGKMRTVIHKRVTYISPDLHIKSGILGNFKSVKENLDEILEQDVTGRQYEDSIENAKRSIERTNASTEQLKEREGQPFQLGKELDEARKRVEEYTELMKKELKEKEEKYAAQQKEAKEKGDFDLKKAEESEDEAVLYSSDEDWEEDDPIYSDAFKDYFGDWESDPDNASKVVDENGRPLIVHHGTNLTRVNHSEPFYVFKPESHFGTEGQAAERMRPFAPGKVENLGAFKPRMALTKMYNVYLNIRNPKRVSDVPTDEDEWDGTQREWWEKQVERAKYQGYDGIVYLNEYEDREHPADSWIAFYPEQIKSADENIGTYDKTNPDIRYRSQEKFRDGETFPIRTTDIRSDYNVLATSRTYSTELMPDEYATPQALLDALRTQYPAYFVTIEGDSVKMQSWNSVLDEARQARRSREARDTENYVERKTRNAVNAVEDMARRMNLDVEVLTTTDGLTGKKARAKGWFNPKTHKIVIVLPNHTNQSDVINTLLHEGVAHYGLRKMFGRNFDIFLDNVYNNVSPEIKVRIDAAIKRNGWSQHEATEEYLARLAERTDFEHAINSGWWTKIKNFFLELLGKAGFDMDLTDNDLRYILWRSYDNLLHPDSRRNIFDTAKDVNIQRSLSINPYARETERMQSTDENWLAADRVNEEMLNRDIESIPSQDLLLSLSQETNEDERNATIDELSRRIGAGEARIDRLGEQVESGHQTHEHLMGRLCGGIWWQQRKGAASRTDETLGDGLHGGAAKTQGSKNAFLPQVKKDILSWAKRNDCYFEEEEIKADSLGGNIFHRGAESNVYRTKDGKKVVKFMAVSEYYEDALLKCLDDLAIQNALLPDPVDVIGYSENSSGQLLVVLEQDYVEGERVDEHFKYDPIKVNDYIDVYLEDILGLQREIDEYGDLYHTKKGYVYRDIHGGNVIIGKDGQNHIIDCHVERKDDQSSFERFGSFSIEDADKNLFSDPDAWEDDIAERMYEEAVAKDSLKWQEAWQDSMAGLKAIQDAIAAETGKAATGAENAYNFENRMHGRAKNMTEQYDWRYYRPMLKAFSDFIKASGLTQQQGMEYLISKSGLERNVYYAFRDGAKAKLAEDIEKAREKLEKDYAKRLIDEGDYILKKKDLEEMERNGVDDIIRQVRESLAYQRAKEDYENGNIGYTEYLRRIENVIRSHVKDYDDYAKDYSGLTETFAKEMYDEAQTVKKAAQRTVDPKQKRELWAEYDNLMQQAYITARQIAEDAVFAAENGAGDHKDLWDKINAATKETLKQSYESGLMDRNVYNKVRAMFDYYIPLRGWEEDKASDVYTYMGKENVFNPAVKKTWGRKSQADNPLAYIGNIAVSTILSGHRNQMKQHFLNYVMNNPTSLVNISESWYENIAPEGESPVWILRTADTAGKSADEIVQIVNDFNDEMQQKQREGRAMPVTGRLRLDVHATSGQKAEHVVEVQRAGHTYQLYINGNPKAAQALNGTAAKAVSRISQTYLGQKITKLNRSMAMFFTSKNPAFVISNLSRDLNMAGASVAIKEGKAYNAKFMANVAKVLTPRLATGDVGKMGVRGLFGKGRGVTGMMPKLLSKWKQGKLDMNDETQRYFKEFMDEGGETGFVNMLSIESFKEKMQKEIREMNGSSILGNRGVKETSVHKALRLLGDTFEFYNRCTEDATRFIVYMTSRQMGKSLEDSIADAKDVTLNFNRKGTGGMGNAEVRDLFIFVNPAIQALANMYKMATGDTLKFGTVTAAFVAGGAFMAAFNQWMLNLLGDDDDKDAYWNLPPWVRKNNLVFWIPFTKNFVTIPLAQEFRVFYGVGEMMSSMILDHPVDKWGLEVFSSVADLVPINPTGNGGNLMVDFAPTMVQPLMQVGENIDFTGKPIWKDNQGNRHAPMYEKAYISTPTWMVRLSEGINDVTGGNEGRKGAIEKYAPFWGDYINNPAVWNHLLQGYFGGMYNTIAKTFDVGVTAASGELPKIYQTPVVNRFLNRPVERDNAGALGEEYYGLTESRDALQYELRTWQKKAADGEDGAQEHVDEILSSDEWKRAEVVSHYERIIKDLKAGERAATSSADKVDFKMSIGMYKQQMMEELDAIDEGKDPLTVAVEAFGNARTFAEKNRLRMRIERLTMRQNGDNSKTRGRNAEVEKARSYITDEERESRDTNDTYLSIASAEDVRDDASIKAAKARLKPIADEYKKISSERPDRAADYQRRHAKELEAYRVIDQQGRLMQRNKKLLGKGSDAAIMRLIANSRSAALKAAEGI